MAAGGGEAGGAASAIGSEPTEPDMPRSSTVTCGGGACNDCRRRRWALSRLVTQRWHRYVFGWPLVCTKRRSHRGQMACLITNSPSVVACAADDRPVSPPRCGSTSDPDVRPALDRRIEKP